MNELVVILGKVCGVGSVIAGRDRRGICCEIRYDLEMRGSGLKLRSGDGAWYSSNSLQGGSPCVKPPGLFTIVTRYVERRLK